MDDDLRNRLRGGRRSYDTSGYSRRPAVPPRPAQPQPKPQAPVRPASPPAQQQTPIRQPWFDNGPASQPNPAQKIGASKKAPKTAKTPKRRKQKRSSRSKSKKMVLIAGIILVFGAAGVFALRNKSAPTSPVGPQNNVSTENTEQPTGPTGTIRMIATGDNLAFESINNAAKTPTGYDYLPMMANFKLLFDKADIRLCNQTTPAGGESLGVTGFPEFNAPTAWSAGFANLGCNVMNLGSDHTNDKGQAGIDATVNTWESEPRVLAYAGANKSVEEQVKVRYFTVKQVKFAYLSFTTKTQKPDHTIFGINIYNSELARQQIEEARKNANLVLVSMSWGNEDQEEISADQDRIAQELADFGADVVIGVGPHVLQPAKILDGSDGHQTLVWFSLGNFLNSQLPVQNLIGGMAVMDFDAATGQLRDPKLLPVYMHYEWTAAQKASNNVNARTNFKLYPLDQAAEPLAKSLNGTTVPDQTARVTGIITKFAPIKVITSAEY